MNGMRRALLMAGAERYISLSISFLTLAVVSRLLKPAEIGVAVVGIAVTTLILSAREFATTNFIIQHRNLQKSDIRAVFSLLLLVSTIVSMTLCLLSDRLAAFYGEPALRPYILVVAVGIPVEVIAAVIAALLRREMAFGKLAIINVAGAAAGSGVTIALALEGFSSLSFAWASLATATTLAALSLCFWKDRSIFVPWFGSSWRDMLTFGGYNGLNVLLYRIYESLPSAVLGRILSFESLALYSRAVTICQLPDRAILRGLDMILLPAFSIEVRNGHNLAAAYLRSVEIITAILWPALVVLAILADPIVRALLGDQWHGAVPLVRIMAIASMFSFSAELNYPILVAMGAMRDILKRSFIAWPVSALVIACAAGFGLKAAALAWLVTLPFQAYVSIYFVRKHVDVSWNEIAKALQNSAVVTLCSAVGPLCVVLIFGALDLSYSAAVLALVSSAVGWGAGLWATGHPLFGELEKALGAAAMVASRSKDRSDPQPAHGEA